MNLKIFTAVYLSLLCSKYSFCQTDSTVEHLAKIDTAYYLQNDTLFSNAGFYICKGQEVYLGKGSLQNGWFTTIGFKTLLAFPLLFLRETELKNSAEYRADPSKRDAIKLQETLYEGKLMVVKKIVLKQNRNGIYYYAILKDKEKILSYKYRCSIVEAMRKGEIKLSKPVSDKIR